MASVVEAQGLTKRYGRQPVWESLSFTVNAGEMVAITGPSGAGKTTLLRCIGLLEKASEGRLRIAGYDSAQIGARQRRSVYRHTFGWLFQNYALVESWSVAQNLNVALAYRRKSRLAKRQIRHEALVRVGLAGRESEDVHALSGGEQQRVALARLIVKRPQVILADEPTAALDDRNGAMVAQILREFASAGCAVLVSTHDEKLVRLCDRELTLASQAS